MLKFFFNADDFGMSTGINHGIVEAYQNGVVNSSSVMVNMAFFEEAVELIQKNKLTNIGLHVNLTQGKSIVNTHHSLVDQAGFFRQDLSTAKDINLEEMYHEIEAQYKTAIDAGLQITHVDSHLHIHMQHKYQGVFLAFSKAYALPLRKISYPWKYFSLASLQPKRCVAFFASVLHKQYYSPFFTSDFFGEHLQKQFLIELIQRNKHKHMEIMCHPGYIDQNNGGYNKQRQTELQLLCDSEVVALVESLKI